MTQTSGVCTGHAPLQAYLLFATGQGSVFGTQCPKVSYGTSCSAWDEMGWGGRGWRERVEAEGEASISKHRPYLQKPKQENNLCDH